ncbi:Methyltransferase domain-containing protein [Haladaptatus litoreus]|uniref:Methyltransferase domain-containing protein n=1 Tax=Haladaptatus litoreus TaxID=553468 RepID=A0A1N7DY92_9EURY|nr:class I SAM-dependent methyltransferase [Haladaptatus litoreus]SIR80751.1 Methyltransferase domain-containing protein [Haladaptatus litoreus]
MGFHTFDPEKAEKLEDAERYRFVSREELVGNLKLAGAETVADLGSGTGFYTDDVAPFAGELFAVDVQDAMHEHYRAKGVPENVSLVTADVADVPFSDGELDAVFSTMTFHEFAGDEQLAEVARSLKPGGRFVIADWTAEGRGESGPPVDERYDLETACELLETVGFEIEYESERPETFLLVASA